MDMLLNVLFPKRCTLCNKYAGDAICSCCLNRIPFSPSLNCVICDLPNAFGYTHKACYSIGTPLITLTFLEYEGVARNLIKKAKYGYKEFRLLKLLTQYALLKATNNGFRLCKNTILVPIPIGKKKKRLRGFNQANIIASTISKKYGIRMVDNLLIRTKETRAQFTKNKKERFDNVRGAFFLKNNIIDKKTRIFLIDDIITSGATVLEASKTFSDKKYYNVGCVALARRSKSSEKQQIFGYPIGNTFAEAFIPSP